jgi:hypothetical protein
MALPRLAEALQSAHAEQATGWLRVSVSGRIAELTLSGGDIVGAYFGAGFQSALQARISSGELSLEKADALWASGEALRLDDELNEEGRPKWRELQLLAGVRLLAERAERVEFTPGPTEALFAPISAERAARAASLNPRAVAEAMEGDRHHG